MKDIYTQKGRIFDIQKFSVHDGSGIRTIVFLKGCVLRCRWCCNPESQRYDIETMMVDGRPKTIGCDVTVNDVLDEVMKDRVYYRRSGGGITLSGGESLCQPDFCEALLHASKECGLDTAMESMGCAEYNIIERILPYLDTRLIIRVPVIPTFNDTPEEIADIARFASTLPGVDRIHLLPYHRLGQDKYAGLGREYTMAHITPMSREHVAELEAAAQGFGLDVQIGG